MRDGSGSVDLYMCLFDACDGMIGCVFRREWSQTT